MGVSDQAAFEYSGRLRRCATATTVIFAPIASGEKPETISVYAIDPASGALKPL